MVCSVKHFLNSESEELDIRPQFVGFLVSHQVLYLHPSFQDGS